MRTVLIVALALLLSGCGFQLRKELTLPVHVGPVQVVSNDPYSALAEALARALERAGKQSPASTDATANAAKLEILSERWADTPISVDPRGRAQEFTMRYAVIFALRAADGTVLVPQQAVELARDYVAPPTDMIGKSSERELLGRELRREMAASILRRIDAASRTAPAPTP